jgi:hypothetical protein
MEFQAQKITNSSLNIGARANSRDDRSMHEDSMEAMNETVPAKQTKEESKMEKRQKRREMQRQTKVQWGEHETKDVWGRPLNHALWHQIMNYDGQVNAALHYLWITQ